MRMLKAAEKIAKLKTIRLRTPMKPFFIEILNFLAWADNKISLGAFEVFSANLSAPTVSPLSIFFNNQPLFVQKAKPLQPNPTIFGIGI